MNYEEKYGERIISDYEERLEQERIDAQERLENLEKCIERIKEILRSDKATKKELQDLISEIEWEINCLE